MSEAAKTADAAGNAVDADPSLLPLFELMVRSSADGMLAIAPSGHVRYANAAAADLLGRAPEELLGAEFGLPLATEEPVEVELFHPRRGSRVSELRVARAEDGTHVAMLRDVSQRVRLRNELQRLALADQLTGVGNRRAFLALADQALKLAEREVRECMLVFVDIDDMKMINDRFGHRAGDRAVIETARMLTDTVRDSDIVARVGGDEFCVMLTGSAARPDSVDEGLARLRAAAENLSSKVDFPLQVTLGSARFDPARPMSVSELMDAADEQMYVAKQDGGANRLVLVVGDEASQQRMTAAVGQMADVEAVGSLEDVIDLLASRRGDLVLVDVDHASTSELRDRLSGRPGIREVPLVAWSLADDNSVEEAALTEGVDEFLHGEMPQAIAAARLRRLLGRPRA